MKAHVDKATCISCGICPSVCPEVFQMDDDGKAKAIEDSIPATEEDSAKEAEDQCPVDAISIE